MQINTAWAKDTAERVARTFIAAFTAELVASGVLDAHGITNVSLWEKAAVAGLASAASLVLALVGGKVGDPATASLAATRAPNPIAAGRAEPAGVQAPAALDQLEAQLGIGHGYATGSVISGMTWAGGQGRALVPAPKMHRRGPDGRFTK